MVDIAQNDWQNIFGRMLLWGFIVLLIFIPVRFALPYIFRKKDHLTRRRDQWKLLQLIVWIFYFSWFFFLYAEIRSWFVVINATVLLALLYLLYRYWLSEVIAGVLFRNQYPVHEGDIIHFENIKGKVINAGNRFIEIENQEGFTLFLPYSKLQSGIIMKSESKVLSSSYTFELKIESQEEFHELASHMKAYLLTLPWISQKKDPMIMLKEGKGRKKLVSVSVFAIDRSFVGKIEQHMRKTFEVTEEQLH